MNILYLKCHPLFLVDGVYWERMASYLLPFELRVTYMMKQGELLVFRSHCHLLFQSPLGLAHSVVSCVNDFLNSYVVCFQRPQPTINNHIGLPQTK